MSALNDLMTRLLGTNWKTSVTGWATALSSFAAVILVAFGEGKWAIIAGAMSAVAKVLNGIVAADATPAPTVKYDPPAIEPGSGGNSGGASFVMLCVVAAASMCFLLCGCGTVMPKLQAKTDALAARIPGGSKFVEQFREYEGSSAGMTTLPAGYELAWRNWYEGKEIDLSKIIPEPYLRPATNTAVAIVSTNTPVPPATDPTSAYSTNKTEGGGATLSDKVGNL